VDVLEHLTQEHRKVEQLFSKLSDAEESERSALIDELEESLTVHMAVEEQHLYPIVAEVAGDETEEEAETEHDLAREGIAKLRAMRAKPGFGAVVDMVAAGIKHHVEEEEGEIFPKLRQKANAKISQLDPEQLEAEVKAAGPNGRKARDGADDATKAELYEQAQQANIEGRSSMTKDELRDALAGQKA
jgi:iron-sulfur cluster repair protein YtfE (RIC family)